MGRGTSAAIRHPGSGSSIGPRSIPGAAPTARADTSEILFEMAATITASLDFPVALQRLTGLALQATGAERCVIFIDAGDDHLVPVAADAIPGVADPLLWRRFRNRAIVTKTPLHHRLWDQPDPILVDDASDSSWVPDAWRVWGSRSLALIPLIAGDQRHGLMALDFVSRAHRFRVEERRLLEAIGSAAGAVVHNARTHEALQTRLRGFEAMVRLTDVVTGSMDLRAGLAALNNSVCVKLGLSCTRASFFDRRLADVIGAPVCSNEERAIIHTWRTQDDPEPIWDPDGSAAVPIPVRGRIAGVLRVRAIRPGADMDRALLGSIAAGIGEVSTKARLAHRARLRSRELAVGEERERIIHDLHDTIGGILFEIGRTAEQGLLGSTDAAADAMASVRSMAMDGGASVRATVDTLAFLHMRTWGLVPAIKFLVEQQSRMSSSTVGLRIEGTRVRLRRPVQRALFLVAYEALTKLERHSRATGIVITLRFERARVLLNIRDDGIDLGERMIPGWRSASQLGLRWVARDVERLGGGLDVQPLDPRGVSLTAWMPTR